MIADMTIVAHVGKNHKIIMVADSRRWLILRTAVDCDIFTEYIVIADFKKTFNTGRRFVLRFMADHRAHMNDIILSYGCPFADVDVIQDGGIVADGDTLFNNWIRPDFYIASDAAVFTQ